MRAPSVSKPFIYLLAGAFSVIVAFAIGLTYLFGGFSEQGTHLVENLRETSLLNQELRRGINEQINLLHRQHDQLDPSFPDKFATINYELGQKQIQYLKLDIGEQERLTVERIKVLQSELGVQSVQVFEQLRSGKRNEALALIARVEGLQKQLDGAFEELNGLQMNKLQDVQKQINTTVSTTYFAIYGLAGGLIATLIVFIIMLQRRVLQPLSSIFEAASQIREGSFSARASVTRTDEIGQVAQGFNFMAESLDESYGDLERKVEERTRQVQELQQQFVQAAKMSAAGQLVSGVAHELNNPLAIIMGYTELGKMKLIAAGGDPEQIKLMQDLHFQAERCHKIVSNLLQFARQVKPQFEVVWINEVVEKILQLREYEFNTRNVKLIRDYDPASPLLSVDKNKLQQIILNLINNAYDAIRETGREGTIHIRTRARDAAVSLEISDTGTGIREPERIFDPFYTTKEVGQGTGLGLSVCYGIVQEHSGEIRAENWEHGARFTVTLPIGDLETCEKAQEKHEEITSLERKYHALIVDDEESLVRLQTSFLSSMGVEGHGVTSGEEAICFLQETTVDIVISDIRMPGQVDGLKLYDWVGENRKELAKRFLFVSGDSIGISTGELLANCSVPRIGKPFKIEEYIRTVRQVLEGEESS